MKGPKSQTPPANELKTNIGNWVIIIQRSENAKLTTNIFAGDLNSLAFRNRYNTNEFPAINIILRYIEKYLMRLLVGLPVIEVAPRMM